MHKFILITFVFCIALSNSDSFAQLSLNHNEKLNELFANVKHYDEFINRFNYQRDFKNNPIDNNFRENYSREMVIESLFNWEDIRFRNDSADSINYKELKKKFINNVIDNGLYMMKDVSLFAKLLCEFEYNNQRVDVLVTLKYEKNSVEAYYWSIVSVESELLSFSTLANPMNFIPPNNDELKFIKLNTVFDVAETPEDYISKQISLNQLPVFIFLLKEDLLKYKITKQTDYYYYGIDGWEVTISQFNRPQYNSGWLISNIQKVSSK